MRLNYQDRLTCNDPRCPRAGELGHKEDRTNVDFYGQPGAGHLGRNAKGEPVYSTPWLNLAKPWKAPADPKPRKEPIEKLVLRLSKEIKENAAALAADKAQTHIGKRGAYGFEMIASDGHRALMRRTEHATADKGLEWLGALNGYRPKTRISTPEFHLAVKRGLVMLDYRRRAIIMLCEPGRLTVASQDPDVGTFDEILPVESTGYWQVCIDGKYLESLCGTWPLVVRVKDEDSAVVFELGEEYRLVVMPLHWGQWDIPAREDSKPQHIGAEVPHHNF